MFEREFLKFSSWLLVFACVFLSNAQAQNQYFNVKVDVTQQGLVFLTQASFYLPLNGCQAYKFITDYDVAKSIPGVIESTTTRIDAHKARVERLMQERILMFPIKMHAVLEFTETPGQGTDFIQISGEAKSYKGAWRLETDSNGTLFKYHAESEPDSVFPKAVIEYFIKNRVKSSFEAMAKSGAERVKTPC